MIYIPEPKFDIDKINKHDHLTKLGKYNHEKDQAIDSLFDGATPVIDGYVESKNNTVINWITKINSNSYQSKEITENEYLFERPNENRLSANIKTDNRLNKHFNATTTLLFLYTIVCFTHAPEKPQSVSFDLCEYLKVRKLKANSKEALKNARRVIESDFEILRQINIKGKLIPGTGGVGIIDSWDFENKRYTLTFSDGFYSIIKRCRTVMDIPIDLFSLDLRNKSNEYVIPIILKLIELYRSNLKNNKPGSEIKPQIVSVQALLNAIPTIPQYNDDNRHVTRDIINKIERALNYKDRFKWEYCKAKGELLSQEDVEQMDTFARYSNLYIKFNINDYPDQSKRIENIKKYYDNRKK